MSWRCKVTGKKKFDQINALRIVGERRVGVGDRPKRECRAYECPDCGWWHLTSRPTFTERNADSA